MFIITAKCSKRRVVKILLIFALLLAFFWRCARAAFVSAARHRRRNK